MIPLLVAAVRLSRFELAVLLMFTGAGAILTGAGSLVLQLGAQSHLLLSGFQFVVAVNILVPFLGGLLIEQITRSSETLAESEARFRRAMHESPIGMLNIDLSGRIIEANPAFASMLGFKHFELEGRSVQEFTPPEDIHLGNEVMNSARSGKLQPMHFQKRYLRRNGTYFWVEIATSLVCKDGTGEPLYLINQVQDIDETKRAKVELAEMERRWDFALAATGQGFWELNRDKGGLSYSTTWSAILGYATGELGGDADFWLTQVHPDDHDRVKAADLAHQAGETAIFEMEYRIRNKSGRWLWVLDRGKVTQRDAEGGVVGAIGTLTDITQRKRVEQDLERTAGMLVDEKERLRVTLNSLGDAVICTDAAGRVDFINPVAVALIGVDAVEAIGLPLRDIYRIVEEEPLPIAGQRATDHSGLLRHSIMIERRDGTRRSIREVVSPIQTENGETVGHVIVFQDFTDMQALQRKLAHAATHDALTGLANRVSFIQSLQALPAKTAADQNQHQLLYIDLDHFKLVNDSGGHAAGDAILRRVAETVKACVRGDDLVARLGGDEFAVIMQSCPPSFAQLVAQNIVDTIKANEFEWQGRGHTIGASIGLTAINMQSGSVDEIVARADAACYAAKAAGRGCVWAPNPDGNVVEMVRPSLFLAS